MNNIKRKKVKPITPEEVSQEIPNWIIEGTNRCIKKYWIESKKSSHFTQDQLIDEIESVYQKGQDENFDYSAWRKNLFKKHYLDIEPIYISAGWDVTFDKPGYCEDYKANFTFSKKQ